MGDGGERRCIQQAGSNSVTAGKAPEKGIQLVSILVTTSEGGAAQPYTLGTNRIKAKSLRSLQTWPSGCVRITLRNLGRRLAFYSADDRARSKNHIAYLRILIQQ